MGRARNARRNDQIRNEKIRHEAGQRKWRKMLEGILNGAEPETDTPGGASGSVERAN